MKNMLTVRVVSRDKNNIDISWGSIGAVEIYNHTSLSVLNSIKQDWRDWVKYILHNEKRLQLKENNVRQTLLKKGKLLESVLFGGKEWRKNDITKYIFITDSEWNPLPFEVLPFNEESLLGEKNIIVRNIRSPFPVPEKKKGTSGILWIQNHPNLKESLQEERDFLESIFDEYNFSFETILGRDDILKRIWLSLNECEYLHFGGHSEREGIYISDDKILLSSEWEGQDLSNISLAFFNTCFSGIDSSNDDGLARTLLKIGVKELVGFSHLIPTDKAVRFAIEFWRLFLKSRNSEYSVLQTRINIYKFYGENDITHLLFVHYSGIKFTNQRRSWKARFFILFVSGITFLGLFIFEYFNNLLINKIDDKNLNLDTEKLKTEKIEIVQEEKKNSNQIGNSVPSKKKNNFQSEIKNEKYNSKMSTKVQKRESIKKANQNRNEKEITIKPLTRIENKESKIDSTPDFDKRLELSELQIAIEKFRSTYNPLLDEKEKEKIIKDIISKEEDESVKRWILKKKTGF